MPQARWYRFGIIFVTGQATSDEEKKKILPVGYLAQLQQDTCCAKTIIFIGNHISYNVALEKSI